MSTASSSPAAAEAPTFRPTSQQVAFFETFGFLRFPGLFAADAEKVAAGFERVFAAEGHVRMETREHLHRSERRVIIPGFIEKDPTLLALLDDRRVLGIVDGLLREEWEYAGSDGNLFYCESSWHPDTYNAPLTRMHLKLSFYLDPLSSESGAIRMIPGTNHHRTPYANALHADLKDHSRIEEIYGVPYNEIPSWTLASEPGDLIVWNYRTIHASFNGEARRRLFSMSFRKQREDPGAEQFKAALRAKMQAEAAAPTAPPEPATPGTG